MLTGAGAKKHFPAVQREGGKVTRFYRKRKSCAHYFRGGSPRIRTGGVSSIGAEQWVVFTSKKQHGKVRCHETDAVSQYWGKKKASLRPQVAEVVSSSIEA